MTTYNTRNPLGSPDPKDLYDNAENLDRALNAAGDMWTDRLGVTRPTVAGALKQGTAHIYATQSAMVADSSKPNGTWAVVVDDADDENNGYYQRQNGVWVKTALQPASAVDVGLSGLNPVPSPHPYYLFGPDDSGDIFDITNKSLTVRDVSGDYVRNTTGMVNGSVLQAVSTNLRPAYSMVDGYLSALKSANYQAMRLSSGGAFLPPSGDFTFIFNIYNGTSEQVRYFWQTAAGVPGRLQISANGRFDGSAIRHDPGNLAIFINGVKDGSGIDGSIKAIPLPVNSWACIAIVVRSGGSACEIYKNSYLVETFTRPEHFADIEGRFFDGTGGAGIASNRILCIHRALTLGELQVALDWCLPSFRTRVNETEGGAKWDEPSTTSTSWGVATKLPSQQSNVLVSKERGLILSPASMTKLLTAYVGLNWLKRLGKMDVKLEVVASDATTGSGNNLLTGDVLTVYDALANLGLPSSNVTATLWARCVGDLIAEAKGGNGGVASFIDEMALTSLELGMVNSIWRNPSGLSAGGGNLSTVEDLSILGSVATEQHPEISSIWSKGSWDMYLTGINSRKVTITHTVPLVANKDPRVNWAKSGTGPSSTNFCLICEVNAPNGNKYIYTSFGSNTDSNRYLDFERIYSSCEGGILWPNFLPRVN